MFYLWPHAALTVTFPAHSFAYRRATSTYAGGVPLRYVSWSLVNRALILLTLISANFCFGCTQDI